MAKRKSVKRRMRFITRYKKEPFCYIEYVDTWHPALKIHERHFGTYELAIAHLTKIKLNLEKEISPWTHYFACKIVEGWYSNNKKNKTITKETVISDEHSGLPRGEAGSGQSWYKPGMCIPIPKGVGPTRQQWYAAWDAFSGSGWTSASTSTI